MENPAFVYIYEGKQYNVFVSKHFQRNIYFRYRKDGFHVSCPKLTSQAQIVKGLNKYAGKLLNQFEKRNSNYSFEEDYVYLLGEKYSISALNLENNVELQEFLKKNAMDVFTSILRQQEQIMGIKEPYKIAVRQTVAQFGSNSKQTHKISLQLSLIHYSKEIIESVIIHELAHDFYRNHQEGFYEVVFKYCPNYKEVQRKLKKGIHK